ncbi:histidinol-phosphatase [soil metagenome]
MSEALPGAAGGARLVLPDPATELGGALAAALACCDEADGVALASFRQALEIETKPDHSFVTAADRAVERAIRTRITATFPEHGLVGEEYGELPSASGRRWFIDPIDGTHNYMRGIPVFATLLALEVDGRSQLGVVSAPALRRRWFAWQGGGAWAVETRTGGWVPDSAVRLKVSRVAELSSASVVYSSLPSVARSGLAPGFGNLLERSWRDRGLGDFWGYMLVAEGAAEVMLEAELAVWDLAGPRAVLEEAGGRLTDLCGELDTPARGALASNGILHDEVLATLRGEGTART